MKKNLIAILLGVSILGGTTYLAYQTGRMDEAKKVQVETEDYIHKNDAVIFLNKIASEEWVEIESYEDLKNEGQYSEVAEGESIGKTHKLSDGSTSAIIPSSKIYNFYPTNTGDWAIECKSMEELDMVIDTYIQLKNDTVKRKLENFKVDMRLSGSDINKRIHFIDDQK